MLTAEDGRDDAQCELFVLSVRSGRNGFGDELAQDLVLEGEGTREREKHFNIALSTYLRLFALNYVTLPPLSEHCTWLEPCIQCCAEASVRTLQL